MSLQAESADAYTGLLSKDLPTEADRLRLLEKVYDAGTTEVLEKVGIEPDWNCLELGAGAGSIAYWLADRAPQGRVVAVDIDPRFIDAGYAPHLTVSSADITTEDFPDGSFDLIHARAVFMHLPRREEIVERAVRWLAPGGWLVLEDVHFLPAADSPYPAWQQVNGGWLAALAAQGIDLSWARRIPATLSGAGLDRVDVSVTPGGLGVDPVQDELLRIRMVQSGQSLIDAGLATADQVAAARALVESHPAPDVSTFVYSSWGQKPAA
ncbi:MULTISPECIES: class I SAM-dependent methyltransferase [unclassified Streptomyces]|uniref:class I SAM-dependent methyltransferase n=1 Tax=unclassified Streptomyces TaxID=2593676 RepID=UPI00382947CB